ncbi:pyridoxal phosphate-dependent aminotransferase [bacterium]|nr:pyridoxal phosphate-dependent aminotransferase [bacterium]
MSTAKTDETQTDSARAQFSQRFAQRLIGAGTEDAFVVLAQAKALEAQGRDIIHLQIGEPDFDTPSNIIAKAHWALDNHYTHYTASAGLMQVREQYANYVNARYGINYVTADNIVIFPGAKPVVFNSCMALLDPGDEMIIMDPTYPAYAAAAHLFGATIKTVPLSEETGFRFRHEDLEKVVSSKTKLFCLNSPQNPTGGILTDEDFAFVAKLAQERGFYVLSDEIYNRFCYDAPHESILHKIDNLDQFILLDGHSKTYAMTGWRLGFSVTNPELSKKLTLMMTNTASCTAAFTQIAGVEALLGDQSEADEMIAEFKLRRDLIVDGLNSIPGVHCHRPAGAFYVFPNIKEHTTPFGRTSSDVQKVILNDFGVACLPGTSFGPGGEGYLRLSYANSRENIEKAVERLRSAFAKLSGA